MLMLLSLLKYRRACLLTLCVLLGLSCGDLAATLLGIRLNRELRPPAAMATAGISKSASDPAANLAFILQHNLFDPAARSKIAPVFSLRQDDGGAEGPAAQGSLELIGTVAAGARSIAVLRSGQETKPYRLGEAVPGGGKIEEIVRHQVKIRNADLALTTLTMHEGDSFAPPGDDPRSSAAAPAGSIRTAGENRWIIPRAAAESARGNLGEQLRMALMQPRIINGRTDGFVVKRITPGTLLAQMGLRRNDVIKRVNSMPIDSPEKALQILQQLREAREISVDLERAGQPLSFAYAIE